MSRRTRRAPLATSLVVLFSLLLPLGGVALAEQGPRSLDLNPETSHAALRSRVKLAATLEDPTTGKAAPVDADVTIYFEVAGPGDPGTGTGPDGRSFESPDLRCTVKAGTAHCRKSYANAGQATGRDTIWAWVDGTAIDDTEGQSIKTEQGSQIDPDGTDVVNATWFDGLPASASLDCNPDVSSAAAGSSKTYTCAVMDRRTPLDGWEVDAENLSPDINDPDDSATGSKSADYDGDNASTRCITGDTGAGQCRMTIAAEDARQVGTAHICFWVDEEGDNSFHPSVDVEWDGALCDTEAVNAPERDNKTDVVALSWKFRRSISLRSSQGVIARGKRFRLSGSVSASASTCVASQTVVIRRNVLRDGSKKYSRFKMVRTDQAGRYSVRVKARKSASYKASVGAGARCYAARSGARKVRVHR
ncbi:hypothetical protein BH24ACT26_BH24ACT26_09740 [soil metagenome]